MFELLCEEKKRGGGVRGRIARSEEIAKSLREARSTGTKATDTPLSGSKNTAVIGIPVLSERPQDIEHDGSPIPWCSQSTWEFSPALAGIVCLWWIGHIFPLLQQSGVSVGKALANIEKSNTKATRPLATLRIPPMLERKVIADCVLPRFSFSTYRELVSTNFSGAASNCSLCPGMQK